MADSPEEHEPDYRFTLANERTFLAWQRTALGLLAAAVAVIQFVPSLSVPGALYEPGELENAEAEIAALADAVKNARAKASELASAAGVQLKAVHRIQHSSETPPIAQPMMFEAASLKRGGMAPAQTELSSGQIRVRVEVQMEFEI